MHRLPTLTVWLFAFCLAGCSGIRNPEKKSPAAVADSKSYFEMLRHRQYAPLESAMDPSVPTDTLRPALEKMASLIPAEPPATVQTLEVSVVCHIQTCDTTVQIEYRYPHQRLLFVSILREENSESTVLGLNLQPLNETAIAANRFTFAGKGPLHFVFFVLAIALPLFSLTTLVYCITTRGLPLKPLWILFILLGIGRLSLAWTTGQCQVQPLFLQLFSAGFLAPRYNSIHISLSLPLGAILFWVQRKNLQIAQGRRLATEAASAQVSSPLATSAPESADSTQN